MEFEVSYSLENEQQFWDGQSRPLPPSFLHCLHFTGSLL